MTADAVNASGSIRIHHGNGSNMAAVATGSAQLVLTSPPYFSSQTEALLRQPRTKQTEAARVAREIAAFAFTLRPVFREIARILAPGGALVLQTKHLVYGDRLLRLTDLHADLASTVDLDLVTQIHWLQHPTSIQRWAPYRQEPLVGAFRALPTEDFLVFGHRDHGIAKHERTVDLTREEWEDCLQPVWRMPGAGANKKHPFQSPPNVVRRFVALYSAPGDLVVDPFAGAGTTLHVAAAMERRTIGYEIDAAYARLAEALTG